MYLFLLIPFMCFIFIFIIIKIILFFHSNARQLMLSVVHIPPICWGNVGHVRAWDTGRSLSLLFLLFYFYSYSLCFYFFICMITIISLFLFIGSRFFKRHCYYASDVWIRWRLSHHTVQYNWFINIIWVEINSNIKI